MVIRSAKCILTGQKLTGGGAHVEFRHLMGGNPAGLQGIVAGAQGAA